MKGKQNNILWIIAAAVFVVVFAVSMLNSDLEHIEDTNGPADLRLTTITDQDVIEQTMGCIGFGRSTSSLSDKVTFDSKKFTGVKQIMWTDIMFSTGVTLNIMDFAVTSGNFMMAVVNEGEIIRVIKPGESLIELGTITGDTSLVIAGESAAFRFSLSRHDYDAYAHED